MRRKAEKPPASSLPRLLDMETVTTTLGVGTTKLNELIERDGLPVFTLGENGRERRIVETDFLDWIEKQKVKTATSRIRLIQQ